MHVKQASGFVCHALCFTYEILAAGKQGVDAHDAFHKTVFLITGLCKVEVFLQTQPAVFPALSLTGLKGQEAPQAGFLHFLFFYRKSAGNGIRSFQDIHKGCNPGVNHLHAGPPGGDTRQVMVHSVLHVGPPEILQIIGEIRYHCLCRDAVGKDAVHMVVSIDKARKKHLSRKADYLHLLIASAAQGIPWTHTGNPSFFYPDAPALFQALRRQYIVWFYNGRCQISIFYHSLLPLIFSISIIPLMSF